MRAQHQPESMSSNIECSVTKLVQKFVYNLPDVFTKTKGQNNYKVTQDLIKLVLSRLASYHCRSFCTM